MKALAVLVLLATAAHADDEVADDYDPLLALRRSFTERDGSGCLDHLGVLRARGVPDTTMIRSARFAVTSCMIHGDHRIRRAFSYVLFACRS